MNSVISKFPLSEFLLSSASLVSHGPLSFSKETMFSPAGRHYYRAYAVDYVHRCILILCKYYIITCMPTI